MLDLETYSLRASQIYSRQTLSKRLVALRQYDAFLRERGLKPGPESLAMWLDELRRRGVKPETVRVYANHVISYFTVMMVDVDERKMEVLKKTLPKPRPPSPTTLAVDEVARLINNSPPPRNLVYALCYAYARRPGEVLSLRWSDVDLERCTVEFTILKKRSRERARYQLEPWISSMIEAYRGMLGKDKVFEFSERALELWFRKDCARVGIHPMGRRLTPHILRHSRITHLRDMGVPLDVVSKYLARHARYDTTVQYYLSVTEEMVSRIPSAWDTLKDYLAR